MVQMKSPTLRSVGELNLSIHITAIASRYLRELMFTRQPLSIFRTTVAFSVALPSAGQRRTMRHHKQGREIMIDYGHFIGGKHVAGTSGRKQDVMQPMDGSVRGTVALASQAELRAAVENAKAAQPKWAATNPQRRVRVLMKFLELVARDYDELADILAREHGKTIADAKGDIQRGLEVVEVCIGAPHMMKGEFTDGAGPGIDVYSMRQPLGVVAGITPFNFPAMIPLWKIAPAIACGNAFILKPSERDPGVPMRIAELFLEAGLPAGILNVVNGDKDVVDAILDDPDIKAIGFVGSTPIAHYIYSRGTAAGKRVQCFGGAKNHMIIMPDADMDQTVDALIGAGYGSAGERCMAISVAVPVGNDTANRLMEKLIPRVESLKVGPSTDSSADFGPLVTAQALERVKGYVDTGVKEGAKLVVDGRGFSMQGYEDGYYMGGCLFDNVTSDMRIYKEEIFGPVLSVVRAPTYESAIKLANDHEMGNGVAIFTRDGDAARDFASRVQVGMVGINVPIPVPIAYYTFGGWKASSFGDLNQHGPDAFRFYTKTKTVTSRWPSGIKDGAEFVIPTMN
jgi:malonate-semialdehyde dehydrogenase (acetylating)/methylmalonate-semialdehyde dehydrogenase